jgi:membrane glycosyltransferase
MQYVALLRLPGLTAMARWQLLQAILLFLGAPLWLFMLLLAVANAAAPGGGEATPAWALGSLMLAVWAAFYAAKLAGYAEVLLKPALAARYGGRTAFARGAAAEIAFTALFEPARVVTQALFLLALPFGLRMGWAPQNRDDRGVALRDAARMLWAPTALGVALAVALGAVSWSAVAWAMPVLASLLLAIPLCVLTADPRVSAWLRRTRVAATPEELEAADAPAAAHGGTAPLAAAS